MARGDPPFVPLVLASDAFMTVERGSKVQVHQQPRLPSRLAAPLAADAEVGRLSLVDPDSGRTLAEVAVKVPQAVRVAGWGQLVARQLAAILRVWIPVERKAAPPEAK